jgi:hypothetical protein
MSSENIVTSTSQTTVEDMRMLSPKYATEPMPVPIGFVPTPTQAFRQHRKVEQLVVEPGPPRALAASAQKSAGPILIPVPLPLIRGSRVLIWKQDPSVGEIGVRKSFLPGNVFAGPSDSRK